MSDRVLLIGLGRMGQTLAAVIRDAVPELTIAAVADPRPDARELAATLAPGARVVSDPAAVIGTVDVVVVASPTPEHPEHVRAALSAGRPVFCEKPLALDPAVARDLGAAARALGVRLQVGLYRRFAAPWVAARRAIRDGAIGQPVLARSSFYDGSVPAAAFADPAVSGGLVVDNGLHELDALHWLLGPIAEVSALGGPDPDGTISAVGDLASMAALLRFESGAIATVALTRGIGGANGTQVEVLGSLGSLRIETAPTARAVLTAPDGAETVLRGSTSADYWRDAIAAELRAFAAGDPEAPGAGDSADATEVALRLRGMIELERSRA